MKITLSDIDLVEAQRELIREEILSRLERNKKNLDRSFEMYKAAINAGIEDLKHVIDGLEKASGLKCISTAEDTWDLMPTKFLEKIKKCNLEDSRLLLEYENGFERFLSFMDNRSQERFRIPLSASLKYAKEIALLQEKFPNPRRCGDVENHLSCVLKRLDTKNATDLIRQEVVVRGQTPNKTITDKIIAAL